MSLSKILILLPSAWLFNVSLISPNPPPEKSERVYEPFYQRICPTILPILLRVTATVPCVAEAAVMLAMRYPSVISSEALSLLILPECRLPSARFDNYFAAGSALVIVGGLGRLWCFRTLGSHFTYELAVRKDHTLVKMGPYKIVRHPSYLCVVLSMLGMSLLVAGPGSFASRCGWLGTTFGTFVLGAWIMESVLSGLFLGGRCLREDAFLQGHFREEWEIYSRRVQYRMIPGVY